MEAADTAYLSCVCSCVTATRVQLHAYGRPAHAPPLQLRTRVTIKLLCTCWFALPGIGHAGTAPWLSSSQSTPPMDVELRLPVA